MACLRIASVNYHLERSHRGQLHLIANQKSRKAPRVRIPVSPFEDLDTWI
jgi:hypothetical protein